MKGFAHVYPMVHELLGSNLADPSKLDLQDSDESAVLQHMEIFLEFWTPGNLVIISNYLTIDQRLLKRCSLFSRLFFFLIYWYLHKIFSEWMMETKAAYFWKACIHHRNSPAESHDAFFGWMSQHRSPLEKVRLYHWKREEMPTYIYIHTCFNVF